MSKNIWLCNAGAEYQCEEAKPPGVCCFSCELLEKCQKTYKHCDSIVSSFVDSPNECGFSKKKKHPKKKKSKMFDFITTTWNPLNGMCPYNCRYCWARYLTNLYNIANYRGPIRLNYKEIDHKFGPSSFVFVGSMIDVFANEVPADMIESILASIRESPKAQFLLLTKNPKRYLDFSIPENCVCGATIETDLSNKFVHSLKVGNAPPVKERIIAMIQLEHPRKMVSIEPIMEFRPYNFSYSLMQIDPEFVAVGYDNYKKHLTEPPLAKTMQLISELESFNIKVYRKTLREAYEEKKQQNRRWKIAPPSKNDSTAPY